MNQELILLAAFGTTHDEALVSYQNIEKRVHEAFPQAKVLLSYTSSIVRKKLLARGIKIDAPFDAFKKAHEEGCQKVILQPLHVIPGIEYDDLLNETKVFQQLFLSFQVGAPLLGSYKDAESVVDILEKLYSIKKNDEAFLFVGHGTSHVNTLFYVAMNALLNERNSQFFLTTIEGFPSFEKIKFKLRSFKKVTLVPFMIVAGDHARNDMGGDEEDSFKNQLEKMKIKASVFYKGLGECDDIASLFVKHIKDAQIQMGKE